MEYYRVRPEISGHTPPYDEDFKFSYKIFGQMPLGEDCGAKIVGAFFGADDDEKKLHEFIKQIDAMVLTRHIYGHNLNLWFVGFGSEQAEMLAKLTLM